MSGSVFILFGLFEYEILNYFTLIPSLIFAITFVAVLGYFIRLCIQVYKKQVAMKTLFLNALFMLICLMISSYLGRVSDDIYWFFK